MLTFFGGLIRVLIGLVAASFAAAAVQVAFALTPTELAEASADYWSQSLVLLLGTATITGLFAAPFALISAIFSEWNGIRSFVYHALVGILIALAGHALLYSGQGSSEPTIVNSYAAAAFLTAGLIGGITYWMFAGRWAYRPRYNAPHSTPTRPSTASVPVTKPTPADAKAGSSPEQKA